MPFQFRCPAQEGNAPACHPSEVLNCEVRRRGLAFKQVTSIVKAKKAIHVPGAFGLLYALLSVRV